MAANNGVNSHAAADLLRQAMMQNSARHEDDTNDQVPSNVPTPSGVETPRPEFSDKRLPGIMHSYFGQNTPPHTPRVSNHEASQQGSPSNGRLQEARGASPASDTEKSLDGALADVAPIGVLKGVVTVKVPEARGLRPSIDPYWVTSFEYSQVVSSGPKHDEMDVDHEEKKARKGPLSAIPMRRTESDMGKPMAIPMKSRQSSQNSQADNREAKASTMVTDPQWDHEANFDVMGNESELDISFYDRGTNEQFLGHVRLCLNLSEQNPVFEQWLPLQSRASKDEHATGEMFLSVRFDKPGKRGPFGPNDFQVLRLIGKGTFGQVFQVRKKDNGRIYAMKVLSKKVIIQKKEVAHTLGERNILVRTAMADSAFIVGLKFSFQTATDLYLVTDFMSGGELFWHLQKEGRFNEPRAKFYIAELILALKHLHEHDIVYRDLKPENILLDANGHIALCDFGLSKANLTKNDTTNTFCGTTEYLAPEVLLDEQGYTKMVDFWSLGVLVFEMCCGWSPFYAEDTQQMYKNIAFGKVRFPRDALSTEGRNFVKGLLNRNPRHRLGATNDAKELMEHPFFADIDWHELGEKNLVPPFKPKLSSNLDVSNFDPEFTNAMTTSSSLNARAAALGGGTGLPTSTPLSPTMQNAFKGFTFVDESAMDQHFGGAEYEENNEDAMEDDNNLQPTRSHDQQMSGVERTHGDDTVFNGNFDM